MNKNRMATIHQPDFLPWLGFFDKLAESNIYIVFDDVQYTRRGWHHRDKIKTPNGVKWITVPVIKKGNYFQTIKETKIDNSLDWKKNHLGLIRNSYSKAINFNSIFDDIENIYNKEHLWLIDLNMEIINYFISIFKLDVEIKYSSQLCNNDYKSTERIVQILKTVNANKYFTGTGSRDYLDEKLMENEGIEVIWQKFILPEYKQLHGDFSNEVSSLDFLMVSKPEEINNFFNH